MNQSKIWDFMISELTQFHKPVGNAFRLMRERGTKLVDDGKTLRVVHVDNNWNGNEFLELVVKPLMPHAEFLKTFMVEMRVMFNE